MNNTIPALFLLVIWAVTLILLATPQAPNSHGLVHAEVEQMDQGGDGQSRHERVLLPAWFFGSLQIAGFVALLAWSTGKPPEGTELQQPGRSKFAKWAAFAACGLAFEAVFTCMCVAYSRSLGDPQAEPFWGPFPTSTAWLMFGLWIVPGLLIVVYVLRFDSWIATPAQLERFEKLVAENRSTAAASSPDSADV